MKTINLFCLMVGILLIFSSFSFIVAGFYLLFMDYVHVPFLFFIMGKLDFVMAIIMFYFAGVLKKNERRY